MLTPLSTQQQSTVEWIFAGGGAGYGINVSLSLRFKGALSKPALERALALVMRRHEGLRSRVQRANGELLQYFADPQDAIELPTLSVATLQEAETHIGWRLAGRLDLECNGPLRAELLELSPQDHILVLIISHTATDTHADDLFISELLIAYDCYVRGDEPALAPAMSFSEYIAGELQAGTRLSDAQLQYWGGVIRGAVAPIPRRATRVEEEATVRGRIIRVSTTAEVTRRLEEFAAASKVSLMAAVCAVIFLAVWREFALEDVSAFTIHSGRDSSRLKTLGASPGRYFPIRFALSNASCLTQLAKMTQTMLLRASIASRLPFTYDRALEQLSQQEASSHLQAAESPQPPGVHLGIIDAMRIKRSVPGTLQQLEVQRVMPGPLLNDPFQVNTAKTSAHPVDAPYIDSLDVLLRRDLASEPDEPLTFVGVFIDSALEESTVRSFLEQICAVAARVSPATQSLPLAQLLAQSDLQPT